MLQDNSLENKLTEPSTISFNEKYFPLLTNLAVYVTAIISKIPNARIVDKIYLKFVDVLSKYMTQDQKEQITPSLKEMIKKHQPGYEYAKKVFSINARYKKKMIENLILRGFSVNEHKRNQAIQEGTAVPFTVLISPTMRCNLQCIGCYANKYSREDDMPLKVLDSILTQAEDMGIAFFTMLGGEPFIRDDLFKIYKKHNKAFFQAYTNGTLINEKTIERLFEVANVVPILSLEGFEKETDERRGKGVYKKVMNAMDLLKKANIPFGFSVDVTRKNEPVVASEEFIDHMIAKGALLGWYFLSMPMGQKPDLSLMPTPKQRAHLREFDNLVRDKKQIFIVDFWNDAPYVGGCIAGRSYVHITPKGWVEPCIFTHLAVDNINDKSLKEVMNSEFFKELRARQPYDPNLLMPCMWIDHTKVVRELYKKYKPVETDGGSDVLKDEELKRGLDEYSKNVRKLYDPIWEKEKHKFAEPTDKNNVAAVK